MHGMIEITVPKLGSAMIEATVLRWFKSVGDRVTKGEALVEIETDKTTHTIDSPTDGIVREILVETGTAVPIACLLSKIEPVKTF